LDYDHYVVVPNPTIDQLAVEQYFPNCFIVQMPESYGFSSIFGYLAKLRNIIQRFKIDLIHAHALRSSLPAAYICSTLGLPLVYTGHGLRYTQKSREPVMRLFRLLEKYVCSIAAVVVVIRPTDFHRVVEDSIVNRLEKVKLIVTRLSDPPVEDLHITPKRNLLLGVGSLIPVKRPDLFLKWVSALAELTSEFEAVWAGDGPLRDGLVEQSEAARLPITFVGNLNHEELSHLYSTARVLLLTSDFETFPLSVLEAASKGVPSVTRQFTGVEDVIVDGVSGVILTLNSEADIGRFLWELLQDQFYLERISAGALSRYKKGYFGVELTAKEYFKMYDALIS
jgi:glycosyltransferase involved in cell wall biosynthesis